MSFRNHVQPPQLSPSVAVTVASSQHQKQTQVALNSADGASASQPQPLNLTINSQNNTHQGATYHEQSHQQHTQQWLAWGFNKIKQKNHYLQNLIVYKDAWLRKYVGDLTNLKACLSSQQQEYNEQKIENIRLKEELETLKNSTVTKTNWVIEHNKVISENNAKLVKEKQDLTNEVEYLKSTKTFWKELRNMNYSTENLKQMIPDMEQVKIRNNELVVKNQILRELVKKQETQLEENKETLVFLEQKVFQLRNEVDNKLREQNKLTSQLNEATSRLTQLNAEIEHMKRRQAPLDKLCESLKNNKLQLTKELEGTRNELKKERPQRMAMQEQFQDQVVRRKRMLLDNTAVPAVHLPTTDGKIEVEID